MDYIIGIADYHVPEEIFQAAGLSTIPLVNLIDGSETGLDYLPSHSCLYCKNAEELIHSSFSFQGAVFASTCTAMEKLYEVYLRKSWINFIEILDLPKVNNKESILFFSKRLKLLAERLECLLGCRIEAPTLSEAIQLNNKLRRSLLEKKKCRAEVLKKTPISLANIREKISYVKKVEESEARNIPRILILGTKLQEDVINQIIQEEQGQVALCLTDNGYLYNNIVVDEDEKDPFLALAKGYLNIANKGDILNNFIEIEAFKKLIENERIDGIVVFSYSYCAKMVYDTAWLKKINIKLGVPILNLQIDETHDLSAGNRTRIAAFTETLSGR